MKSLPPSDLALRLRALLRACCIPLLLASPVIVVVAVQLYFSALCWRAKATARNCNATLEIESQTPKPLAFLDQWIPYGLFPRVVGIEIGSGPVLEAATLERLSAGEEIRYITIEKRTLAPESARALKVLHDLTGISLFKCELDAVIVEALMEAPNVTSLNLFHCTISGDLSSAFKKAGKLESLVMSGPNWDTEGLAKIPQENRLARLGLYFSKVRDEEIPALPNIYLLHLFKTNLTGEFLRHVAIGDGLFEIYLNDSAIGDEAMSLLAARPEPPVTLGVSGTQVSDEGVLAFAERLQKMGPAGPDDFWHQLDLRGCRLVTDVALDALARTQRVREVWVYETGVTPGGIQRASRICPEMTIVERDE